MEDGKPRLVVIGGKKAKVAEGTEVPAAIPTSKQELLEFLDETRKQVEEGLVTGIVGLLIQEDTDQVEFVIAEDESSFSVMGRLQSMIHAVDMDDF
jgi:hypothetical protein